MWLRLDENFPDHPKVVGLTDSAFRLHVTAMCYARRALTDGHIPDAWVPRRLTRATPTLVDHRLWVPDPQGDGWIIHGWLDWNPSRAEIEDARKRASEAGRRGAAKRWGSDGVTP